MLSYRSPIARENEKKFAKSRETHTLVSDLFSKLLAMYTAQLLSKTFLTPQMIELKLKTEKIETQPGQRFFINYLDAETPLKRAYSIADVEMGEDFCIFTFLIKLNPESASSALLKAANENSKF